MTVCKNCGRWLGDEDQRDFCSKKCQKGYEREEEDS